MPEPQYRRVTIALSEFLKSRPFYELDTDRIVSKSQKDKITEMLFYRQLRWIKVAVSGGLAIFLATSVAAEDIQIRDWHVEDGLPDGTVTSMALGADGFLWLGTPSGLARFDGAEFRHIDGLPEKEISGLTFDENGALWITGKTGVVIRHGDGRIEQADRGSKSLQRVGEDISAEYPLWLARFPIAVSGTQKIWSLNGSLLNDRRGEIWRIESNIVSRLDGETWTTMSEQQGTWSWGCACIDAKEGIWVTGIGPKSSLRKLWHLTADGVDPKSIELPNGVGTETKPISAVVLDRHGRFWLSNWWGGIWRSTPDGHWEQVVEDGPLARCVITGLLEDRQGAIWVATLGEGLHRIAPKIAEMVMPPDTGERYLVLSSCGDQKGRLWFAVADDAIYSHDATGLQRYSKEEGLDSSAVHAVWADRMGAVWAGTEDGLYVLTKDKFARCEVPTGGVVAFFEDRAGGLWMGDHGGKGALWHREPNGKWAMLRPQDDNAQLDIRCIAEDAEGTVWVAAYGTGLWRVVDGQLHNANKMLGINRKDLRSVFGDTVGGLWLGTLYGGLWHWQDNTLSHYSRADGLPDDSILGITEDGRGGLWFSSSNGVFGCSREMLAAKNAGGPPLLCWRVTPEEGLANRGCSGGGQPVISRLGANAICVANMVGVAIIRPKRAVGDDTTQEVRVESVLADSSPLSLGNPSLSAPASVRRFEFEYAAPDLGGARNQRFRYRLEPLDGDWLDAGSERRVAYSRLAPGTYHFRVMVGGADGGWRESTQPIVLLVTPRFWQTPWFAPVTVAVIVALLGIWGVWWTRSRMRRRLEVVEMGHAIERERARIARDIHDDLGTNLTEILMISEAETEEPADATKRLQRIGSKTRSLIQSLDEIVWAVGPANDNLPKLADYICAVSEELCESAGVRCWHEVPPDLPMIPLPVDYRHQVFLMVKEAFNNTLKHAKATESWLLIQVVNRELRIEVRDNGCGISSNSSAHVGNGLSNMRTRIESLGGRMDIRSEPATGTKVLFAIPLPHRFTG